MTRFAKYTHDWFVSHPSRQFRLITLTEDIIRGLSRSSDTEVKFFERQEDFDRVALRAKCACIVRRWRRNKVRLLVFTNYTPPYPPLSPDAEEALCREKWQLHEAGLKQGLTGSEVMLLIGAFGPEIAARVKAKPS